MKTLIRVILIILGLLAGSVLLSAIIWPPINDVSTGATPEYPEIQPISFEADAVEAFWIAARTAKSMPLWILTSVQQKDLTIEAEARTATLGFVDLVEIRLIPSGHKVQVNMRSRSQLGRSDLGVNARRIKRFLKRLTTNMQIARLNKAVDETILHK